MTELKRNLSLPLILFYGLGTILGAGIYVLTGVVADHAGVFAPLAFVIAALVAAPTAFSYGKLSARFPRSAGEAVYVNEAFNRAWLSSLIGLLVVAVGIISSATISRGFVGYFEIFWQLPAPVVISGLVIFLGGLAIYGVFESVGFAALIAIIEIIGLMLVIYGGAVQGVAEIPPLVPSPGAGIWTGVLAGGFLAFYAFIGFEDIVNMAEETKNPSRNLPLAIMGSLGIATLLYFLVAYITIGTVPLNDLKGHPAPMALVIEQHGIFNPGLIAAISMLAVINGALVQIIMASRVIYGMSRMQGSGHLLGEVHAKTRTPIYATLLVTAIVLTLALLFDLQALATVTSAVTLTIFFMINGSLVVFERFSGTGWVAILGMLLCLLLLGASFYL